LIRHHSYRNQRLPSSVHWYDAYRRPPWWTLSWVLDDRNRSIIFLPRSRSL
jgi:hypothetical protein